MYLKVDYTQNFYGIEITFLNTMVLVESITGNMDTADIKVGLYNNANNYGTDDCILINGNLRTYNMPIDPMQAPLPQAYDYLRTLPEFQNAVNC